MKTNRLKVKFLKKCSLNIYDATLVRKNDIVIIMKGLIRKIRLIYLLKQWVVNSFSCW